MTALETIRSYGVIPVLGLKNPDTAARLGQALIDGGLSLIEVTLRHPNALQCLENIKKAHPDMLVGAGTVLDTDTVDKAKAAGADFIVSPGCNPVVVKHCQEVGLPIVAGCVTPTEIEAGMALGLTTFKFFPSEAMNGLDTMKQLAGPYQNINFIPTSGINFNNLADYLSWDRISAIGGSFMAPAAMIEAEQWDEITSLCKKCVDISLGFELAHIGINGKDTEEGMSVANWFGDRFRFPVKPGVKSNFAGTAVEACNGKFPGDFGHIGIGTRSPERAEAYFKRMGIPLRDEFRNVKDGKLIAVYLKEEVAGFAVHIVKK